MASVASLGIHRPSAIPYLIAEGILPEDPPESLYRWQIFSAYENDDVEEDSELLTTDQCVVWSRNGVLQRVFRFEVEGEVITQATLTRFPVTDPEAKKASQASEDDTIDQRPSSNLANSAVPKQWGARTGPSRVDLRSNVENEAEHLDALPLRREGKISTTAALALVVVLKTQAHVYYLSGPSHIIHLPFEVDSIFPLSQGVLLQRRLSPKVDVPPPTPVPPSVPQNSFSFSNLGPSWTVPSAQALSSLTNVRLAEAASSSPLPVLSRLFHKSTEDKNASLPRLFCLTDPLAEIGSVVVETGTELNASLDRLRNKALPFQPLPPEEILLFVSDQNEMLQTNMVKGSPDCLYLALTANERTRLYTVWSISPVENGRHVTKKSLYTPTTSGTLTKRRSSYGRAVSTGATTPALRESLGPMISRDHGVNETGGDQSFSVGNDDLASQLDPAFENPAAPARSSRRVSSLLARADLSTSHDRATFADLAIGQNGGGINWKAASFGLHGSRLSGANEKGVGYPSSNSINRPRTSFEAPVSNDTMVDDLPDEMSDESDLLALKKTGLGDMVSGLRNELVMKKIKSLSFGRKGEHSSSVRTTNIKGAKAFTLKPPEACFIDKGNEPAVVMCLVDADMQELLVLQIVALPSSSSQKVSSEPRLESNQRPNSAQKIRIRVASVNRFDRVIDACKIRDHQHSRILVLTQTEDGFGELTLQAPWSLSMKVELPSKLQLHNPYELVNNLSPRQRREGGLKRILSKGPQALSGLQYGGSGGRVAILDSEGLRHCIEIQLRPRSRSIRKMIKICEYVLPASPIEAESISRVWWEVTPWLRNRSDYESDLEWTSFVVVIFLLVVNLVQVQKSQATIRSKKRQGGLLRSSSGANNDTDSWEAMLNQEINPVGGYGTWVHDNAWAWTGETFQSAATATPPRIRTSQASKSSTLSAPLALDRKNSYLLHCTSLAQDFAKTSAGMMALGVNGYLPTAAYRSPDFQRMSLARLLIGLHLYREELKLNSLDSDLLHAIGPVLAQIGGWLRWDSWGYNEYAFYMLENVGMEGWLFDESTISGFGLSPQPFEPPSILHHIENLTQGSVDHQFLSLTDITGTSGQIQSRSGERNSSANGHQILLDLTPRTTIILRLLALSGDTSMETRVAQMASSGVDMSILETIPEGIVAPLRAAIAACQPQPRTTWGLETLRIVGRDDIGMLGQRDQHIRKPVWPSVPPSHDATKDIHSICNSAFETATVHTFVADQDRMAVTRLIYREDQRFAEATKLVNPLKNAVARCPVEPDWSDTDLLEAQKDLVQMIAIRTLSLSSGRAMLFYCARLPLLTEQFPIHGFSMSCVMKPANTTVTADKQVFSEEKVSWAFFHAGVEAGLSISKHAQGIDTSWILFNRPEALNMRHAGFLLALGLNGHLKTIAKWVAFKYLTPKHTMTSIGLLLGLSASYLGSMDTLVTRLLSVHVTRMLPPGAAELNLSPLTQTTGIMGIGLLYCNSQHRRMSEIMLSEMENTDQDDNSSPLDTLRDEGYRLAAGFALGYINLGKGKDLRGLHDMHIVERLLILAVGTKKVSIVHILDKASAAAVVAIALIFMKTQDSTLASKIDIPDTTHQFDYVRPDLFLLRTVARHLIMWDNIEASFGWVKRRLPLVYQHRSQLTSIRTLSTQDMPFLNIVAGLCFSIGLRFAGSGSLEVRNVLGHYLDQFIRICRLPALTYDGKLTRVTVRNCQSAVALAAASVMAGTGDLYILRRLRSLHGRVDADTPYGSHLATHLAIGVLFIGGGTYTFGTSNLAIASLFCAFYPLFPSNVMDNKSHLQAFRHFWVFAAEARCIIARDIDTHRPVSVTLLVTLSAPVGAELALTAPCLLPDLDNVVKVQTTDPEYWNVTLDFANNSAHREAFKRHQSVFVHRRAAYDAHNSVFSATLQALNDAQSAHFHTGQQNPFEWIFNLSFFKDKFNRAERALVLPPSDGAGSEISKGLRGTVVDERLVLGEAVGSGRADRLWGLRLLFAWAEKVRRDGGKIGWLGEEVVERLRAETWVERNADRER